MNKTRKVFSVIIACVIMLFAAACSDNTPPFTHGTWSNGRTYTSEYLGIRFALDITWMPISDANLAKTAKIVDMSEHRMKTHLDEGGTIYELIVSRLPDKIITITVQDNKKNSSMSEKEFFDSGLVQIKADKISAGHNCTGGKSSVSFLGKSTDCLKLTATKDGTTTHHIIVPVFKKNYTACIEFVSQNENDLNAMVALASAI